MLLLGVGSSSENKNGEEEAEEVVEVEEVVVLERKKVMLVVVFDHRVKKNLSEVYIIIILVITREWPPMAAETLLAWSSRKATYILSILEEIIKPDLRTSKRRKKLDAPIKTNYRRSILICICISIEGMSS